MPRAALALIALALGLGVPASAVADSSYSLPRLVHNLDVRANHVAWTVADNREREHLHGGFAETDHELPVPPAGFFDGLDLGTDRRGRTVLVYARCPKLEGRPCALYLYNPRSRRERRLESVSRRRCRQMLPHIDRGILVFAREARRGRCRGGLFMKRPGHRLRRIMRKAPSKYDFAGRLIAFERYITATEPDPEGEPVVSEIRLLRIGRHRSRLVVRARGSMSRGGSEGPFVSGPRLDGGFVYWQRSVFGAQGRDDILRRPVRGGPTTTLERAGRRYAASSGGGLLSFAVNAPRLFYVFGGSEIGRVEPAPVFR